MARKRDRSPEEQDRHDKIRELDQTFPGFNGFFDSPARSDGSQKWVDFVYTYWHVDCVRGKSLSAFTEHYRKWVSDQCSTSEV